MSVNNLAVVMISGNESLHIERAILNLKELTKNIFIVDSFSEDGTFELAQQLGAVAVQRKWVNHSDQFQWAIDNCPFNVDWILRMDVDELLDAELQKNIRAFVANPPEGVTGCILNRKHIFMGKWVRFGGRYPLPMVRLFKRGCAHVEQRWMDEHIVLEQGASITLKGGFEDNNLNAVGWFIDKHNGYATREMLDIKLKEILPTSGSGISENTGLAVRLKRWVKEGVYNRLPYFVRPALYFLYRYFIQFGFLDGARGFAYHFMQGFWYRALVDLKCLEVDRLWANVTSVEQKISVLEEYSGYDLSSYRMSAQDAS